MAAASGTKNTDLITTPSDRYHEVELLLRNEPWRFQFFQGVRLLERLLPERSPVGRFAHPAKEVIRFGVHSSTAFPASHIQDLQLLPDSPALMVVNFMGLTGPMGVLPLYYSELVLERLRAKDRTLASFLDLFNHRLVSLFYQAWEKYRFTVAYERGERDRFSHHLLDLIGLGTPGLQDRQAVPDDSLLFYSGLFSMHNRSAAALRQVVSDYFDVPVEVEQFVGAWYPLSIDDQCCFETADAYSEQLGIGAVVGDEIYNQQSGVRLRLGPLDLRQYIDFLPEGSAYEPLKAITRFFAGEEIDFQVQLVLKRGQVPGCELDDSLAQRGDVAPQLGWSTWVKTVPMNRDPADTVLRI
jgi:type VI secretion system protein ImpH